MILRPRRLGPAGLEYVSYCLRNGNTFASLVLDAFDVNSGTALTFLPQDTSGEKADQLRFGGKMPTVSPEELIVKGRYLLRPAPSPFGEILSIIRSYLSLDLSSVAVFEDLMHHPSDPSFARLSTCYVTLNDEVYHVLTPAWSGEEQVIATLKQARSIPDLTGVLTVATGPILSQLKRGASVDHAALASLARATRGVVVGAYDGESYVIWQPEGAQPLLTC